MSILDVYKIFITGMEEGEFAEARIDLAFIEKAYLDSLTDSE